MLVRREGRVVNHKLVYKLYKAQNLELRLSCLVSRDAGCRLRLPAAATSRGYPTTPLEFHASAPLHALRS
ncbi:MAG: hypothetical protein ACHQ50_06155 [Fimbriimonadales bacterium]